MRELSLNILDIAQNSISAGASLITIDVSESRKEHLLTLTVSDNGCGMTEEFLKTVTDPFSTTRTTSFKMSAIRFSPRAQRARSAWAYRCSASRQSRPAAVLR